ncbi:MAG: RES family NAD+ phosphorylase [Acidobacteriaceae bacterium]
MARRPVIPPLTPVHLRATHRMIAAKHSVRGSVLSAISDTESMLADLAELDGATNDRLLGEDGLLPGISVHELVYGVRYASIVNAAFTHKNPAGSRFNDGTRGAWYAGLERATSVAEVAYHRAQQLANIDWTEEERATYDDYLADFTTEFHDLRAVDGEGVSRQFRKFLKPGPVPACYAEPQQLARKLLASQSNGLIYPSVRHPGGTCIACFRPALVYHVRRDARIELRIQVEGNSIRTRTRKVPIPAE